MRYSDHVTFLIQTTFPVCCVFTKSSNQKKYSNRPLNTSRNQFPQNWAVWHVVLSFRQSSQFCFLSPSLFLFCCFQFSSPGPSQLYIVEIHKQGFNPFSFSSWEHESFLFLNNRWKFFFSIIVPFFCNTNKHAHSRTFFRISFVWNCR